MPVTHVPLSPRDPAQFRDLLGPAYEEVEEAISRAPEIFAGRVMWHVNSTARGGGVVELLESLLTYTRGAGVDARWAVIDGDDEFFRITKRIHNNLHGFAGDGGPLGAAEREVYERTLSRNEEELIGIVSEGDIVYCHDPQTAGLVGPLIDDGATVVWRCHVGFDLPNDIARKAWDFLRPYVEPAHAYVFSRREFVWEGLAEEKLWIIPPSIDVFTPKNQEMSPETVAAILSCTGLAPGGATAPPAFKRLDGSPGRVDRAAEVNQDMPIPAEAPLIAQVSRWDALKDPVGVLRGFTEHLRNPDAHLLLAGPSAEAVADDPEGAAVLAEVRALREGLPEEVGRRVHLACLPMADVQENAAIVNAIQRRADIVVQKSLAEGFGLTVAEAMWKARPVIAGRRGGIQDQIPNGEVGLLLDDPSDLRAFAAACDELLADPARAERIGVAARQWVIERFLGPRHLLQYLHLLDGLLGGSRPSS
jgi:trehalose synthase